MKKYANTAETAGKRKDEAIVSFGKAEEKLTDFTKQTEESENELLKMTAEKNVVATTVRDKSKKLHASYIHASQ